MGNFARPITTFPGQQLDPYWENVVLYTRLDAATPLDLSDSAHTLTVNSATRDTTDKKFGASSFSFGNGTENISAADDPDWDLGAGEFTIECWIRFDSNPAATDDPIFLSQWNSTGNQRAWTLSLTNHLLSFQYSTDGTVVTQASQTTWDPDATTWYHLAVSRDQDGIVRVFLDGALQGSHGAGTTSFHNSTAAMHIGWAVASGGVNIQRNIDEVRITKGVCRYKEDFTPQLEQFPVAIPAYDGYADPYWDHVVFHTDFDTKDVPIDNSHIHHPITMGAGASIDTSVKKWGEASLACADSATGYITVPDSEDWDLEDKDFTLEGWFLWDNAPSSIAGLISQWLTTGDQIAWMLQYNQPGTVLRFWWTNDGLAGESLDGGSWTPTADVWYHIAVCRNGADLRFFIDGVQSGSTGNISTEDIFNSTSAMTVGANAGGGDTFDGHADGIRITKGIARYTSDFIPPVRAHPTVGSDQHYDVVTALVPFNEAAGSYRDRGPETLGVASDPSDVTTELTVNFRGDVNADFANTATESRVVVGDEHYESVVLLTRLDHVTPIDVSNSGHTITVNGATRDTSNQKFGASCFDYAATTDDLSFGDHADWHFSTGDFTIELWVNWDDLTTTGDILGQWNAGGSERGWLLRWNTTGDLLEFFTSTSGGDGNLRLSTATGHSTGTWYHVAVCRVNGDLILYFDGDEIERVANSEDFHNSTAALTSGERADAAAGAFNGKVDDIRITKGVGRYPSSFIPPTRPHSSEQLINTSGPFTIEGFIRFETDPGTTGDRWMVSQYNFSQDEMSWYLRLENEQLQFTYTTDGTTGTLVTTNKTWNPAADQWYHIALTRDASNDMRWFVDGVQIGTTSSITATFFDSSAVTMIGNAEGGTSGNVQAYFSNWRFTAGVARYTADFFLPQLPPAIQGIDPRDLGNVDIWYDASAEGGIWTDDNADVVSLRDLSSNGHHMANVTAGERPVVLDKNDANAIGSLRTIEADGSDDLLRVAVSDNRWDGADQPFTLAVVGELVTALGTDTTEDWFIFGNTADSSPTMSLKRRDDSGVTKWRFFWRDDADTSVTIDETTAADLNPHVIVLVFHGTTLSLWIDGVNEFSETACDVGTMTIDEITIGGGNLGGTEIRWSHARFGEVILYDEALGDNAVAVLANYLAAKWGI